MLIVESASFEQNMFLNFVNNSSINGESKMN